MKQTTRTLVLVLTASVTTQCAEQPTDPTQVVRRSAALSPVSTLGTQIAFVSTRYFGIPDVWVMNPDGGGLANLTETVDFSGGIDPDFSPDGTKITFTGLDRVDIDDEIYVMNADGSLRQMLTSNRAADFTPRWSPDGSKIAFSTTRDGQTEVYVMNRDGTNPTNISNNARLDVDPSWSPDGLRIIFTSSRDSNSGRWLDMFVINADGVGPATNLTFFSELLRHTHGRWSPDGSKIVFTGWIDNNDEIFVMDANGQSQTRLTFNPASDREPAWSPDGTRSLWQRPHGGRIGANADGTENPAS
jgi:Tol biopolymer transport system component